MNWDYMPGVSAAGHVTSGGAWHPGASVGCTKCGPEPRFEAQYFDAARSSWRTYSAFGTSVDAERFLRGMRRPSSGRQRVLDTTTGRPV